MGGESDDITGTFDDPNWTNPGQTDEQREFWERLRKKHEAAKRDQPATTAAPALAAEEKLFRDEAALIASLPDAAPKGLPFGDPDFKPLTGFRPLGQGVRLATSKVRAARAARKKPGATKLRVIEAAVAMSAADYKPENAYQHSILCQTCLPYRDPGPDVLEWNRANGLARLSLEAGKAMHPNGEFVRVGLPFGPKPRLILAYLNTQAILNQTPVIEVEQSLSQFIAALKLDSRGRNSRTIKDQLARLAASRFTLGFIRSPGHTTTVNANIVQQFDLWFPKNEQQRVLWPTSITLSTDYFESLVNHAVPLDAYAISKLAHSAMALDIYTWLAQRLHRVHPSAPAVVSWVALHHQFGEGFGRIRDFRRAFTLMLNQVKAVYAAANITLDKGGMILHHSPPPIAPQKTISLPPPKT